MTQPFGSLIFRGVRRLATSSTAASKAQRSFTITRLSHLAIATNSIDKQREFWRDVMGLEVGEKTPQPQHGVRTVVVSLSNTKLELLDPIDESPINNFLKHNKSGAMHHVCLEVDNIQAAMEHCAKFGIRCLSPEPRVGARGNRVVFLHPKDCGGVLIEFEERT